MWRAAVSALLMLLPGLASSIESWRLQSVFSSTIPVLGGAGARFATRVTAQSGGELTVQFLEPGTVAGTFDAVAAVARGDVESAYTTPFYSADAIPAIAFFTAVPFGARGLQQFEWVRDGTGRKIFDEFYARLGVKAFPCATIGPEGGGWFSDPIDAVSDFEGLKMRFFGLGADVVQRLGATTVLLGGDDVLPALQAGTIDAAEFSTPYIDELFGFDQAAPNYYYPSWHQDNSITVVVVNPDAWARLSAPLQALVESVCDENVLHAFDEDRLLTAPALGRLGSSGVAIREFPPEVISAAWREWQKISAERSASDPDFERTYRAFQSFLATKTFMPILEYLLGEN